MNVKAPVSVDLNVTGRCNLKCGFCWGPSHEMGEVLNLAQWKKIIQELADRGTKAIIFTGGEPLLRDDIDDLISFAKSEGLRVTLSTNATLLVNKAKAILPFVDEVGIPIDGVTDKVTRKMRPGCVNYLSRSLKAVKLIKTFYPSIEITIRTLISKANKEEIESIGKLICDNSLIPNRWKLYEFIPLEYGATNKEKYHISHKTYNLIVKNMRRKFPKLNISTLRKNERKGRYFLLMPDGDTFAVNMDNRLVFLGNIRYNFFEILENSNKFVSRRKNIKHGFKNYEK